MSDTEKAMTQKERIVVYGAAAAIVITLIVWAIKARG